MKEMKKVLSFFLVLVMVLGMVPATVFAAEGETVLDAAIFCSDLHGSTSELSSVLSAIGTNIDASAIGFNGDTCLNEADLEALVKEKLSDTSIEDVYSYASSHDGKDGGDIGNNWDYSGKCFENNNYIIYTIRETDMISDTGADEAFTTWYSGLTAAQKAKPIFILSHRPLHARRNDNNGAAGWYAAISAAAESSDIVFFWAHNHTGENDVDTAAYYVPNDGSESITVQGGSTVGLNFTYMNAGYMNANGQNGLGRKPVATTVQITADSLIFQDYTTSGTFTGTYAHNVTVEREFAATVTPKTLEVTAVTEYSVGQSVADPTEVKVTYSDDSYKSLTEGTLSLDNLTCEITDAEGNVLTGTTFTAAGTYYLNYTYTENNQTATATLEVTVIEVSTEPTVNTVSCVDDSEQVVVEATALGLTAVTAENVTDYENAKCIEAFTEYGYMAFDIALEGHTEGNSVDYSISVVPDLDTTNLELYYIDADGNLIPVEYELVSDDQGNLYVEFTTTYVGTFVYGSAAVPEGYTLTGLTIDAPYDVFLGTGLDLENAVITATYTMEGAEDFVRKLTSYDYDEYNFTGYDVYTTGQQTVTFTFEGMTATTDIYVWGDKVSASGVTVELDTEGKEYGVTDVNVAESTNPYVDTAVSAVLTNYVAYDISLVYAENYAATDDIKTVTLPIPEGVENPAVYYVSDNGYVVMDMKAEKTEDGTGVTFTTDHFSTYVVGDGIVIETENGNATVEGTGVSETTVYVLVSSLTAGKEYLIVNANSAGSAFAMGNSTAGAVVTINAATDTITNPYISNVGNALVWTASSGWGFASGDYNLGVTVGGDYTSRTFTLSTSTDSDWSYSSDALSYTYRYVYTRYLACSSAGTWSMQENRSNVYFYEKQTISTGTVGHVYSVEGTDVTDAVAIPNQTVTLSSQLFDTPDGGTTTDITATSGLTPTYEVVATKGNPAVVSSISGNTLTLSGTAGTAVIKVTYTSGDLVAWDEFIVTATTPDHYSIQLHYAELTKVEITEFAEGVTYYTFNETTNTYDQASTYVEGTTYYTAPAVQGEVINETVALKGIEAGDTYSVWAVVEAFASADSEEGMDIGKLGDALSWQVSDETIATIDPDTGLITFTGSKYGTFDVKVSYEGADGKVITDTITISVTESLYVVPGDGTNDFPEYPSQGAVRFDKTATAVGNFSETGIAKVELSMTGVPYTTGKAIDALLVLDMSTSMKTSVGKDDDGNSVTRYDVTATATKAFIKTIVQNDDGTYNNNTVCVHYFNGTTAYTDKITNGFITISSDKELQEVYDAIDALVADPPSTSGTDYSTSLETAYNTIIARDKVSDNTQALVFMSDGGPTYYTYLNDSGTGTALGGSGQNGGAGSTIVGWFDTDNNDTSNDETDDTATPNSSFKQEYYTYLLKNAEPPYPVYTVGLGLAENSSGPSAYTGLTSGVHEAITSYILSSMATNSSYFYNVADSDAVANMGNIFSGIAASIKEAAKDVVVEDKIGNNYSINFSLPDGITSAATDGIEDFYIQVVDYVLDSTTHERTGTYTVLENFTFDGETGKLQSHTVDGVACGDTCSHVTTTNGAITAITGTYFQYKSDSTGEYLTWTAEKLTSTELALQYFAYLDDSAGTDVANQIPAGTYYTNEYATLTYTNVNNKVVQQEFPKPQMTWNGAQVSYVFYLVNAAGQPVNRAGKVVPFAEAVFVTDVFTYSVIWNDLEQSAGLEARYLAEDKVPDAYELYDDDANYQIHVYEKETEVNLNNHFVIGGDVTDDYNTVTNTWTNAKTTYVFNTKSDATKYTTVGAYVADNGNDTLNQTGLSYFCKSASIQGATYTTSVENDVTVYTVTSVGNGYQKVDGETQATVAQITAAGGSTTGGTTIGNYIYYVDENGQVYTIVQKTNGTEVEKGFDFANTTVAFAVVWKPELVEDTVIVDFGLDVVIDVIANDNMAAGVVGVRVDAPSGVTSEGTYTRDEANTLTEVDVNIDNMKIGTATVENLNQVRFSLDKTNGMQFTDPAVFYYEADVNYYDSENKLQTTSMYSKVTVIPATTIYYEDSFVTYESYTWDYTNNGWKTSEESLWTTAGTTVNATQDQDRPGASKISEDLDADNNYGYDSAYSEMSEWSLGSAAKATVDYDNYAAAKFSFFGTGFDVISMTNNTTGSIVVNVYQNGDLVEGKSFIVDTYYGYKQQAGDANGDGTVADGEVVWVVDPTSTDSIYQVPVIKVEGLTYGKYDVEIKAVYDSMFEHVEGSDSYDFYLDAIRIYNPTGNQDDTANNAYVKDGEGWPTYVELRNQLIAADTLGNANTDTEITGMVFIDGDASVGDNQIEDYKNYGPNNEVYLASGQSVAFMLSLPTNIADVQIGIKSADGAEVAYTIKNIAAAGVYGEESFTVKTTTDMYYDLGSWKKDIIVITNTGSGILSLTNIKFTYTSDPNATQSVNEDEVTPASSVSKIGTIATAASTLSTTSGSTEVSETTESARTEGYIYMTVSAANLTVSTLNTPVEEEPVPEETIPEETVPEEPEAPTEPEVPEDPATFEPEKLTVSLSHNSVTEGGVVIVTVRTSEDVESLTVNGETISRNSYSRRTKTKTWVVTVRAEEVGDLEISVVAHNAAGEHSEAVVNTVTVKEKSGNIWEDLFGWIFG